MLKRLGVYCKEMFPIPKHIFVGAIVFLEIYFIVLLNYGITSFSIGIQEFIGSFTIFSFLFLLRIADDFKDFKTDSKLFPDRPLPSGRVKKSDLIILASLIILTVSILNLLFMNNLIFFLILMIYGALMSVWFFNKAKIQKNLILALITHNPVQMIMNIYIISFTCIKYGLEAFSYITFFTAFTLYFPALIWEIARKIRAPGDETEYVTYSKLWGYKKAAISVGILIIVDIITNIILLWNLNIISIIILLVNLAWIIFTINKFIKQPENFKIVDKVMIYTGVQESVMLLTVVVYLIFGKI